MSDQILDPASAQRLVLHADASRYMAMAGFTVLIWDHLYTFREEVHLMWTAPRSLVKALFLGNRYITPVFIGVTVVLMSRLVEVSDTFCRAWTVINGFAEISSLASADLLLLLRIHALWGRRREVIIGTYILYFTCYGCIGVVGLIAAIDIVPQLRFHPITKQCFVDHKPKVLPAQWTVSLILELFVFFMTAIKAFQQRKADQIRSPVMRTLYYDQFMYYVVIVVIRIFNLAIWLVFPPSLFFLGLYFIWSLIIAMVSRILLHLRSVACAESRRDDSSFFGPTARTTQIVWAKRYTTGAFDTGMHPGLSTAGRVPVTEVPSDTVWDSDGDGGERIELQGMGKSTSGNSDLRV